MKSKKIIIYRRESALCGSYFERSATKCILLIAPAMEDPIRDKYIPVLRKIASTFLSQDFSLLHIPIRFTSDKSKNQNNLNDVLEASDWLFDKHPDSDFTWVCGAGYGGYLSLNVAMRRPRMNGFVSVSPILSKDYTINALTPCPKGIIMHGDQDEYTDYAATEQLASTLIAQKNGGVTFELIEDANHTYDNHLNIFESILNSYVTDCLHAPTCQKVSFVV